MENVEQTSISQYRNSPTLVQLVTNMNGYIRQDTNFAAFYDFVWNVNTAKGFGLNIWGKIVDVSRNLQIIAPVLNFGFNDGVGDYAPFNVAPFYAGPPASQTFTLLDDAYRVLILAKALANISATTSPALNQLLRNLFPGRGRCYVNDLGNMHMRFVFEFPLEPYEYAILTQSGALPHPGGVKAQVVVVDTPDHTFGFAEAGIGSASPFNCGSFYSAA
jgi:hypothetical protein